MMMMMMMMMTYWDAPPDQQDHGVRGPPTVGAEHQGPYGVEKGDP